MRPGSQSGLLVGVVALVLIVFVIARRMRPQPVNPRRMLITAGIFVVVLLVSLGSDWNRFVSDVPALIAAPFALVIGGALGFVVVRAMRFWTDAPSGQLWMRGGLLFAAIYVATLALRVFAIFATSGSSSGALAHLTWLPGVSADLVLLSIGMWIVRASLIVRRYQQHVASGGTPAGLPQRTF
ncbi:MAG: hypothetical protein ACREQM_06800 [Candidatus Dormibacteraceae bacterium]